MAGGAIYHRIVTPTVVWVHWDAPDRSYVLVGEYASMERSFGSACHGAGRRMSRGAARRLQPGREVQRALTERGIVVHGPSMKELAEEAPEAYKDVDSVVEVVERAGLARRVARTDVLGVIKG